MRNSLIKRPNTRSSVQAANAMALYVGLVEPENEEIVLQNLIDDIRSRGNALTAGDVGYRYVVQTLLDRGASDVLFDMNSRVRCSGIRVSAGNGRDCTWPSRGKVGIISRTTTVCWDTSIHGFLPDWVESRRPIHRPPTRRS